MAGMISIAMMADRRPVACKMADMINSNDG